MDCETTRTLGRYRYSACTTLDTRSIGLERAPAIGALARRSYLASVAVIPAGIASAPPEYHTSQQAASAEFRTHFMEPVVPRLATAPESARRGRRVTSTSLVRVENTRFASNNCGMERQRNYSRLNSNPSSGRRSHEIR
jgi:hypothetical protein